MKFCALRYVSSLRKCLAMEAAFNLKAADAGTIDLDSELVKSGHPSDSRAAGWFKTGCTLFRVLSRGDFHCPREGTDNFNPEWPRRRRRGRVVVRQA